MAKSKNINLNLTPEIEIAQTLFDEWRQSIDGYNGTNPVNPSNFEILDSEIGRINAILETVSTLKFEKVNELPDKSQAKENIIYLVPASNTGEKNYYEEYIFLKNDNKYELIGSTQITFDNEPTEGSQNGVTSGGVYTALQDKVDKEQGKGLSSNDYTNEEKSKLAGIETGAQVNVQADWKENDPNSDSYIANKPTVPASQVNSDWNAESGVAKILNKPDLSIYAEEEDLSEVAFSGSYNDLTDKPTIPSEQVQADWSQDDDTQPDYIKHKPDIPSGQVQSNWAEEDPDKVSYIQNKPDFEDMIAEEQSRAIAVETELETKIEEKQDELTAGENIRIENSVISATVDEFAITSQELSQIIAEEEDNTYNTYVEEYDDGYIVNLGNADVNGILGEFDEETSPATYNQFTNNVDL